jgi:hypothetical protein
MYVAKIICHHPTDQRANQLSTGICTIETIILNISWNSIYSIEARFPAFSYWYGYIESSISLRRGNEGIKLIK